MTQKKKSKVYNNRTMKSRSVDWKPDWLKKKKNKTQNWNRHVYRVKMAAQSVLTKRRPEITRSLTTTHYKLAFPLFRRIQTLFAVNQTYTRANRSAFHLSERPPQFARRSKDSSVSIVNTLWGLRPTIRRQEHGVFLFSRTPRPVPELNRSPIQRILGFYPCDKAAGSWGWPPPSNAVVNLLAPELFFKF